MAKAAALPPGSGSLDLGLRANTTGAFGYLEYQQHVAKHAGLDLSLFADGWAGVEYGKSFDAGALAGLRMTWGGQ